jgi:hypothetical protein
MPRQLSVSAVARVERLCGLGDRHGRGANALRAPAVPTCGGGALPRGGEPGLRAYVCPNCDAVYNVLVYPESPLRPEVKSSATIMSSTPRRPANGVHGFRWFTVCAPAGWDPASEEWEVCPCGWRPELRKHYAKASHVQWWREQIKERGSLKGTSNHVGSRRDGN